MKQILFFIKAVLCFFILFALPKNLYAQQQNCSFNKPFLTIDFNAGENDQIINQFFHPRYRQSFYTCPIDGSYAYVSNTSDCFNGDWLTFPEDHTPGDNDGKMMLVNANVRGGVFFDLTINGLKENTIYQLAAWLVNVCRINGGCSPLPPNINMTLMTKEGKKVASFQTGVLAQNASVKWKRYAANFTTPAGITSLILTMEDKTFGGCGNDFAMDDISISECNMPVTKQEMNKVDKPSAKPPLTVINTPAKKAPPKTTLRKDSTPVPVIEKKILDTPVSPVHEITVKPSALPVPEPILTRENPLIKHIETLPGEILIELYDNGQVDGDTVSVYHNNMLVVSHAGLTHKPVSFHITADEKNPHHELIMVADNLGSIPPNTSLMIITAGEKRYEIFISSTEQKNAKVTIDLQH